jgi:hypothetical protein
MDDPLRLPHEWLARISQEGQARRIVDVQRQYGAPYVFALHE